MDSYLTIRPGIFPCYHIKVPGGIILSKMQFTKLLYIKKIRAKRVFFFALSFQLQTF